MNQISIKLLGAFTVAIQQQPVMGLGLIKAQALLAFLASESGQEHSRDGLMGLLWPENSAGQARNGLRVALYRLREALDRTVPGSSDELLTVSRRTIRFHRDAAHVDVLTFQQQLRAVATHDHASLDNCTNCLRTLFEAVALYEHELLSGMSIPDAQPFEEWLLLQRESLHQQLLSALSQLTTAYEQMGDYALAHTHATKQIQLDPYREEAHRQLMRILARQGLPEQAEHHFNQLQRLLAKEIGASPEPESEALLAQIRDGTLAERTSLHALDRQPSIPVSLPTEPIRVVESTPSVSQPSLSEPGVAWGNIPRVDTFYGRSFETQHLTQWLEGEGCRLVSIFGMGGMGKTTLAAHTVNALADQFSQIVWYSLRNAPSPAVFFSALLRTFVDAKSNERSASHDEAIPNSVDEQLSLILQYLRQRHLCLILDNWQSVLDQAGSGLYRTGYEAYGQLLELVATWDHQSQLLITSRERPLGLSRWEGDTSLVRSLQLDGLDGEAGQKLLAARGFSGSTEQANDLIRRYSGSPLALKVVAEMVEEMYHGDVDKFLSDLLGETLIMDEIRIVCDQQFEHLTPIEKEILFCLATEHEPITLSIVRANLSNHWSASSVFDALRHLQRRSLVDRVAAGFGHSNLMSAYLTDRLVAEAIGAEVVQP